MAKQLVVSSAHPKLRGSYVETGSCEGRPAFLRQGDDETWILFSARFGSSPGWYQLAHARQASYAPSCAPVMRPANLSGPPGREALRWRRPNPLQ
ncbi:Hypothetical protein (Fragment) [Durusdinium trenchii]|uniref:Uncharacterized protein n=1 Tax=Durusdinium trenchii TaxID=1381693 RepID=A0ABP0K356_9DINO